MLARANGLNAQQCNGHLSDKFKLRRNFKIDVSPCLIPGRGCMTIGRFLRVYHRYCCCLQLPIVYGRGFRCPLI